MKTSPDPVKKTIAFVKDTLRDAERGHDWFHTERVWQLARYIREEEGSGDPLIIDLASLLHDIADPKFHGGNEELGGQVAFHFLTGLGMEREQVEHIQRIVRYISFSGGTTGKRVQSAEFRIVQDADRLDALGAIGIARTFHYGGFRNRLLYDPSVPVRSYPDAETYYSAETPTINHFYEKLLKLKDLMNTETGKRLARERHDFMEQFLARFYREIGAGNSPKKGN